MAHRFTHSAPLVECVHCHRRAIGSLEVETCGKSPEPRRTHHYRTIRLVRVPGGH